MFIFKRVSLICALLLSSFYAWSMEEVNHHQLSVDAVYNIKNTYSIVHDCMKHLSLLNGALAWETGFIRRLYDFGEIRPVWGKKDERGRSIITGYEQGGHATARLVHAFFYRIPSSTSLTDFAETKQLIKNVADNEIISSIADILICCFQARTALSIISNTLEVFGKCDVHNQLILLRDKNTRDHAIKNEVWHRIGDKKKLAEFRNLRDDVRRVIKIAITTLWKKIRATQETIEKILNPIATLSLNKMNKNEQRGEILLRSLLESTPGSNHSLYLAHITETILLSFVYKKYGKEKNKITFFYNTLDEKLNKAQLCKKFLKHDFIGESFSEMSPKNATQHLNEIFKQNNPVRNLEEILFYSTQQEKYPRSNDYIKVVGYEIGGITTDVVNCFENALKNFIRLMTYDRKSKRFSVDFLQQRGAVINEIFADHIKTYNDPKGDCSNEAHLSWLKLISQIPYVLYCRTIQDKKTISANKKELYAYLMLPREEKINKQWLTTNKIKVINKHGYELQPSLRNLIIVLNHLLGLNLFNDKIMIEEIVRPDFIKAYFPLLCKKIGCTGFLSTKIDAMKYEKDKDFDALDFVNTIYTAFIFSEFSSQIKTYPGHGELNITHGGQMSNIIIPEKRIYHACPLLSLLITQCIHDPNRLQFLPTQHLYSNLFALDLENSNQTDLWVDMLTKLDPPPSSTTMKEIVILLLRIIEKQPDEDVRISLTSNVYKWAVNAGLESFYRISAQYAGKLVHCEKIDRQSLGIEIFKALVQKNNGFSDATESAGKAILTGKSNIYEPGVDLFKLLFDQNYEPAYEKAFAVVLQGINSEANGVVSGIIDLLDLFEKVLNEKNCNNAFVNVVIKIANTCLSSNISDIRYIGLSFFKILFEQNKAFKEGLDAAINACKSNNQDNYLLGLDLFKDLFEKNNGFSEAIDIATKELKLKNKKSCNLGTKLFKLCFKKGYGFSEAEDLIKKAQKNNNEEINSLKEALEQVRKQDNQIIN